MKLKTIKLLVVAGVALCLNSCQWDALVDVVKRDATNYVIFDLPSKAAELGQK